MKTIIENQSSGRNTRTILGIILFLAGALLLVDQLNLLFIPDWLFSWPMILIIIGLYIGAKHNFHNLSWLILVLLGIAFLLDNVIPGLLISNLIWPAGLIILGVYIIMRRSFRKNP